MSYKQQQIEWDIPEASVQVGIAIGYELEFSQNSFYNPIIYTLTTYNESTASIQGTFYYSLDDGTTWVDFPIGEAGQVFNSAYKMRVVINSANSNFIFAEKSGTISRVASDGSAVLEEYTIDTFTSGDISINSQNNAIYLVGQDETIYKTDTYQKMRAGDNSINAQANPIGIAVDGTRDSFWQIDHNKIHLKELNGNEIFSLDLPQTIDTDYSSSSSSSSSQSSSSSSSSSSLSSSSSSSSSEGYSSSSSSEGYSSSSSSSEGYSSSSSSSSIGYSSSSSEGYSSSSSSELYSTSSSSSSINDTDAAFRVLYDDDDYFGEYPTGFIAGSAGVNKWGAVYNQTERTQSQAENGTDTFGTIETQVDTGSISDDYLLIYNEQINRLVIKLDSAGTFSVRNGTFTFFRAKITSMTSEQAESAVLTPTLVNDHNVTWSFDTTVGGSGTGYIYLTWEDDTV